MSAQPLERSGRIDRGFGFARRVLLVALVGLLSGCGDDATAPQEPQGSEVTLSDGTRLAIPAGGQYFYGHVEITGSTTAAIIPNSAMHDELVIARIDWSFCNPSAAKVDFWRLYPVAFIMPEYTWRIPTRVTTPLAGINILGIFAGGGTLEGGLRVNLDSDISGNDMGAAEYRILNGCAGDWISFYGYTK